MSGLSTETPFNVIRDALGGASFLKEGDAVEAKAEGERAVTAVPNTPAPADFVPVDPLRIDRTAIIKFKKVGDVSPSRPGRVEYSYYRLSVYVYHFLIRFFIPHPLLHLRNYLVYSVASHHTALHCTVYSAQH